MKLYVVLFLFALLPATLFSRDITTLSGTTYKDVTVNGSNAIELIISLKKKSNPERTILKPIPFTDLPDAIRKEFKYDPAKAEAFEKSRREFDKKAAEEKQQKESEKVISPDAKTGGVIAPAGKSVQGGSLDIKQKPVEKDIAQDGKNDAAEAKVQRASDKAVSDATDVNSSIRVGSAPGALQGTAESLDIRRQSSEKNTAPGAKEGAAEADKIRTDAIGGSSK
jgi:hypothetical protein